MLRPGISVLWLLLMRSAGLTPLLDQVTQARVVSLLAGAAAGILLLWRSLIVRRYDACAISAGAGALRAPVEVVAAIGGVITVVLSRSFFLAATSAGPSAVGLLHALAVLALAEYVARAPGDSRPGLGLAGLAGLAAGGPQAAVACGWPVGALVVLRALRRGARSAGPASRAPGSLPRIDATLFTSVDQRWPVLAPFLFVAGVVVSLGVARVVWGPLPLSAVAGQVILAPVIRALAHLSTHALTAAVAELADQVGILAVMVALAGLSGLGRISLFFSVWSCVVGLVLRAAFGNSPDGTLGMMLASSALALPLGAGIVRLADCLGRARLPAAAAMGIMLATWPLLAR